jgi:hypothetical protein
LFLLFLVFRKCPYTAPACRLFPIVTEKSPSFSASMTVFASFRRFFPVLQHRHGKITRFFRDDEKSIVVPRLPVGLSTNKKTAV